MKNNNNFGRYHLCFRQTHIFISSICGGKTNSNRDLYRSEWGYNMMSCDNDVMFPHDMRCLNMSIKGIPIPPERSAIQDGHHARSPQQQWLSRRLLFFSFLAVDVGQYAVKTLLGVTFGSSPQGDDSVPRWQATLPLFHGLCWISPRICESTEAAPCGLPVHRGIGVFGILEGEQIFWGSRK